MFVSNTETDNPLSEREFAAIIAGTAKLYLWGRIEFVDAYGRPRWAIHRSYWDPSQSMIVSDPKVMTQTSESPACRAHLGHRNLRLSSPV